MKKIVISGSGLFIPPLTITNEELVSVFNQYVEKFNQEHAQQIAAGEIEPKGESSVEFIEKASGIKRRHVLTRTGILDVDVMQARIPERVDSEPSVQSEIAVDAARKALASANKSADEIDAVIVSCTAPQRLFPAVAIEVQEQLGINGYAFDMNVACSSATFGIQTAVDSIKGGSAKTVLTINPEMCSSQLDYTDRDSHFIFGDACTATVIEATETCKVDHPFEIISTKLKTSFSNNIRSNFGFLNRCDPETVNTPDKYFIQQGRKVFKEVVPMAASLMLEHIAENNIKQSDLKRLWLHQANINMNRLIAERVLGHEASAIEAPIVLDEFANTSSAGSVIAFHQNHADLQADDIGLLCSFGAGYSIGSVILKRL